jgi:hypothetical protein
MKDNEFIELLNLYLDAEISPAEASRLEAEVQRNPERYRVYQQYCRMQKACTLLAADFTADAPTGVALKAAPRRAAAVNLYAIAGLMAAAACVAFVFVYRTPSPSTPAANEQSQMAQKDTAPAPTTLAAAPTAPETARTIAQTVTVPAKHPEFKPVLVMSNLLSQNPSTVDAFQDVRFSWIDQELPALSRMPADSLRFDRGPAALKPGARSFGSGSMQPTPESAAFQFQR